jgi:hypothetical protein
MAAVSRPPFSGLYYRFCARARLTELRDAFLEHEVQMLVVRAGQIAGVASGRLGDG